MTSEMLASGARALLEQHADYFLPGRHAWSERVDSATRERIWEFDRALFTAWVTSFSAELAQGATDPLPGAMAAVRLCKAVMVNQRSVHANLTEALVDDDFHTTDFCRLVRGFVNCEGQNHVLLHLLRALGLTAHFFETVAVEGNSSTHLLVFLETANGWTFVDCWADFPVFWVADLDGLPLPNVPEYAQLDLGADSHRRGVFAREAYLRGRHVRHQESDFSAPRPLEQLLAQVQQSTPNDPAQVPDSWVRYLKCRVADVLAGRVASRQDYERLREGLARNGVTHRVVSALLDAASA